RDLWNTYGRTIVLHGDVFFTEDAIDKIVNAKKREWTVFFRWGKSRFSGSRWDECFAWTFWHEHIPEHLKALYTIRNAAVEGKLKRCAGWEHYRAMEGLPLNEHARKGRYVEINDWTEDFDSKEEYLTFVRNWN